MISICIPCKNRSRNIIRGQEYNFLPNCVKAIAKAFNEHELLKPEGAEIIVADWNSTDWPLEEWIYDCAGGLPVTVVQMQEPLSRGRGRNHAAQAARGAILMFLDADVTVEPEGFVRGIMYVNAGCIYVPLMVRKHVQDPNDQEFRLCTSGYGNIFMARNTYQIIGPWPERFIWGLEDSQFVQQYCKRDIPMIRCEDKAFVHQWHPKSRIWRDKHYRDSTPVPYSSVVMQDESLSSLFASNDDYIYHLPINTEVRSKLPSAKEKATGVKVLFPSEVKIGVTELRIKREQDIPECEHAKGMLQCNFSYDSFMDIREKYLKNILESERYEYDLKSIANLWLKTENLYTYFFHQQSLPGSTHKLEDILNMAWQGMPCAWWYAEPFKFSLDVDLYAVKGPRRWASFVPEVAGEPGNYATPIEHTTTIQDVIDVVSKYCEFYLVCQSQPSPRDLPTREAYNIYTDRFVTYEEAKRIELEIAERIPKGVEPNYYQKWNHDFTHRFKFPIGCIGSIFNYYAPMAYRRVPYSIHADVMGRRLLPNLELSRLPSWIVDKELELLRFSYPNMV